MSPVRIIPINSAQSHDILSRLRKASKKGKLILFLGAGASINIDNKKPGWRTLAEEMVKEYNKCKKFQEFDGLTHCRNLLKQDTGDYKEIFTTLEQNNKPEFWTILDKAIRTIPKTETLGLAHILAYLNPLLIITTNWDRLLDGLRGYEILNWKDNFREDDINTYQYISLETRFTNGYPSILFLHGHISRLDTVLITHQQYNKLYSTVNEYGPNGTTIEQPKEFKNDFKHKPSFDAILRDRDVEVLFFGMDPKNREFKGLVRSVFGKNQRDIFVLSSAYTTDVFNDIDQNIKILNYPKGRHDLALDFLVRLEPRKSDYSDNYKVFATFDRKKYLDTQKELEKEASSIKYCTPRFTNVFGDDLYILEASKKFADAVYSELEKHGDKDDNLLSKDAFVKDVYNGMIGRRNNIREMIENNKIKSIYILFTAKPKTDTERIEDNNRIKETIELCNKGKVSLQIRQIDLNKHKCLEDEEPFKDPSMALIIGNSNTKFKLGLCHASQATITSQGTDKSYVRFQWVHTDTIFSQNRLSWFDRAWELAEEYN